MKKSVKITNKFYKSFENCFHLIKEDINIFKIKNIKIKKIIVIAIKTISICFPSMIFYMIVKSFLYLHRKIIFFSDFKKKTICFCYVFSFIKKEVKKALFWEFPLFFVLLSFLFHFQNTRLIYFLNIKLL